MSNTATRAVEPCYWIEQPARRPSQPRSGPGAGSSLNILHVESQDRRHISRARPFKTSCGILDEGVEVLEQVLANGAEPFSNLAPGHVEDNLAHDRTDELMAPTTVGYSSHLENLTKARRSDRPFTQSARLESPMDQSIPGPRSRVRITPVMEERG